MKRRWFQFRLRTLFVLLTLAAVVTGVVQHVWYVRQRIQFHEAKLATCEERLAIKVNINSYRFLRKLAASKSQTDSGPTESERICQAIGDGYLLYTPETNREIEFNRVQELVDEHMKELASLEDAQRYHQQQAEAYRRAMWRPWMRVAEDRSQELADEPAEPAPAPKPTVTTQLPAPAPTSLEESVPQMPVPARVRLPWQPIERPVPLDFDERDVQVEKTADA